MSDVLKVRLISDKAKVPYKAYNKSAGFDLFSAEDLTIKKLTKGNPTMTAKFEDLKKKSE